MKRLLCMAMGLCLPLHCLGDEPPHQLPPGCHLLCAEGYLRATELSDTATQSINSKEFQQRWLKAKDETIRAYGNTKSADYALRYASSAVGAIDNPISAVAAAMLNDSAEAIGSVYDDAVAYSLVEAVDKDAAAILRSGGRFNPERASALANAVQDPAFLAKLDDRQREALGPIYAQIQAAWLKEILSQGLRNHSTIDRLSRLTDSIASQLGKLRGAVDESAVGLESLRRIVDAHSKSAAKTQRLLATASSQSMSPAQKLFLAEAGILEIDDPTRELWKRQSRADETLNNAKQLVSSMGTVANALKLINLDAQANAMQGMANVVSGLGTFAAGLTLKDPMMIFQGGTTAFGALGGLMGKRESSEEAKLLHVVLKQVAHLREEIWLNHVQVMQTLTSISKQAALNHSKSMDVLGELLYQSILTQEIARFNASGDMAGCSQLFSPQDGLFFKEFGIPSRVRLDKLAAWFANSNASRAYIRCGDALSGLTLPPRSGALWKDGNPGLGESPTAGLEYLSDKKLPSVEWTGEMAHESGLSGFVFRTLKPIAAYAARYVQPDSGAWVATLSNFSMRVDELDVTFQKSPAALDEEKAIELVDIAQLMPAGDRMLSADKVAHLAELTQLFARIAVFTVSPGGDVKVMTPDDLIDCAQRACEALINARDETRSIVGRADEIVQLALAQEVMLTGAPILPEIVDVVEEIVLPEYRKERAARGDEPLSGRLASVVPRMPTVEQSKTYTRPRYWMDPAMKPEVRRQAATCTTGNQVYDTLCLLQTNPWLARNAVRLLVHRQRMRILPTRDADPAYRRDLLSRDVNAVRQWVGQEAFVDDSARNVSIPGDPPSVAGWALQLPRIDVPPYYGVEEWAGASVEQPANCWGEVTGPLPYAGRPSDARWAWCVPLPVHLEGALLDSRRRVAIESVSGLPLLTYHASLRLEHDKLQELLWSIGEGDEAVTPAQARLIELKLLTERGASAP